MSGRRYGQECSFATALDTVGERWSLLIVRELLLGPLRFSDLVRLVGNAPTDVLTKRLRDLEADGIVRRRRLDPPASATVYELSELGRGLERPLVEMARWGMQLQRLPDVIGLPATSLANALRAILQPSPEVAMTVALISEDHHSHVRLEDGHVLAARGEAPAADLRLAGTPVDVLAGLVVGGPAEERVEAQGDRSLIERLRAMVVIPDHLREEAAAAFAAPVTSAPA
jgi:DNA-binding HxlR family transcriptional regulator